MTKDTSDERDWLVQVLPWDIIIFKRLKQAISKNTHPKKYSDSKIRQQLIADMQAAKAGGDVEKLADSTLELFL